MKKQKEEKESRALIIFVLILIIFGIYYFSNLNAYSGAKKNENFITNNFNPDKENIYPRAIELVEPEGYINTDNITIKDQIGKNVVLIGTRHHE